MILGWAVVILIAVFSIILIMGKGSSLIAGYNTASKEEKEKYNVKLLFRTVGVGSGIISLMIATILIYKGDLPKYIQWLNPWGYLMVAAIIIVLSNTICKKK